jgi:dTDP-4-dehydrorhamnose 3,5-epimerase
MRVEDLAIAAVKLLTPVVYRDERGSFIETWNRRVFAEARLPVDFVQDNHAYSRRRGTLRGLHFQIPPRAQDKLVRVVRGAVLDVAVDLRRASPTFGRHVAALLSAANGAQLWVPKGFAHGYVTLEPDTEVIYKVTDFYSPTDDRGLAWNDPALGIDWRVSSAEVSLSEKDRRLPPLAELPVYF